MRKALVSLTTLICLHPIVPAAVQQPGTSATLTVQVQDSSGSAIPAAVVSVKEENDGRRWRRRRSSLDRPPAPGERARQATDASGSAVFHGLVPGVVSVMVSAPGFLPNEAGRVELIAGQQTEITIQLPISGTVSESVVVTGSGVESLAQESPVPTQVITRQMIDREVKTTLAEAFEATISGVRTEMNCQNCGFMQLRINGLEGPYTQVLEDGLPTYSGVAAVYGLEQIPAGAVDQIEVVKGGNSALYGPGAVAGVVNLIRREPRENHFRIDALAGWQFGRPEQQAGGAAQLTRLPAGFSGDFYYRGINRVPIDRDRDGFSDLGKRQLQSGGFGLFRRFIDGGARLSVSGTISDEFRRGGDQFDRPPHETWITEQVDSRRYTAAIAWNHALSPRTFYNLRASHAYYSRQTYYGSGMDSNAYGNTRNPLWVGDVQFARQQGQHTILGGYQALWEFVSDRAPAYGRTYGGTFYNHGLYLQDEWRASRRFSLLGGARLDKSNQIGRWIVSPRAGIKLGITDNLMWRTTLSTGFRAPAVFDEDLHITQVGGEGFLIQNNPNLQEEKAVSFSTGMQYMSSAAGRPYQLAWNVFHTSLRNAFTLVEDEAPDQQFRRLYRVNGPGAQVTGVDIDGSILVRTGLSLRGGFSLQRARWKEPEEQFGARDFFRTPRRYGFLSVDLDLPGGVQMSATADYTGSMLVPHYAGYIKEDRLEQSRRFVVFNATVGKPFALSHSLKMRWTLNLQNMGDSFQRDLDRGPSRDAGYVYGPAVMRRIVTGLTCEF